MIGHTPTAYFIGGAPRTGKTTLAQHVSAQTGLRYTSTDALRAELRRTIRQSTEPALYYLDSLNANEANMADLMLNYTQDIIAAAERESAIVWRTVETYVRTNVRAGHDILVEGVAVLPRFVASLDIPYSAVFLGNLSPTHTSVIEQYARTHPQSWLGKLERETVQAFAHFSRETSAHVKMEAKTYKLTYIAMEDESYEQQLALSYRRMNLRPRSSSKRLNPSS